MACHSVFKSQIPDRHFPSHHLLRNRSFTGRHTRLPVIRGSNMLINRVLLTRLAIKVLPVSPSGRSIVVPEQATLAKFGEKQLDNILE